MFFWILFWISQFCARMSHRHRRPISLIHTKISKTWNNRRPRVSRLNMKKSVTTSSRHTYLRTLSKKFESFSSFSSLSYPYTGLDCVRSSTRSFGIVAFIKLNHFTWIKRRINFPIKMQASSFTTKFTMENSVIIAKPHGGSNTNAKSDIVSGQQGASSKASNSILFSLRTESKSCVFTKARANRHLLEFRRVDRINSKRDISLNAHIRAESLAGSRFIVSHRRKVPGRTSTACVALAKPSGWTAEHSSYR